ncbi:4-oxalocrotonate tautomerase family protein [Tyzzerella sp. OttesenSCG-928-J15]|nr:4-oxalocrotonate tautomerase family protein [Tyzzerella sp. OttesenSCG-928-J15]
MPFIHISAYSGRDLETKKKAVQAIVKAASEAMGTPESAFTVAFEDIEKEKFAEVMQPTIDKLSDKMIMRKGEML